MRSPFNVDTVNVIYDLKKKLNLSMEPDKVKKEAGFNFRACIGFNNSSTPYEESRNLKRKRISEIAF